MLKHLNFFSWFKHFQKILLMKMPLKMQLKWWLETIKFDIFEMLIQVIILSCYKGMNQAKINNKFGIICFIKWKKNNFRFFIVSKRNQLSNELISNHKSQIAILNYGTHELMMISVVLSEFIDVIDALLYPKSIIIISYHIELNVSNILLFCFFKNLSSLTSL